MAQYYDWASFEKFVKEMYEDDGEVTVLRDVTDTDRYGAKRQTDVKIIRRSRFHQFVTLVECKRWKDPVSRDRIDVLASSIEALGAHNGAVFTTTGFEEGAIAYAKGKGIELFVVRDLTDQEWGAPGRHVELKLHVGSGEFQKIQFAATAIPLIDTPPSTMKLDVALDANMALDPDLDLHSVQTGKRGPNLVGVLADAHQLLLSSILQSISTIQAEDDTCTEIVAQCELDLLESEYHQLRLPECAARVERIGFEFRMHVGHSQMSIDRGKNLDFAVMVESYVSEKRLMAHRKSGGAKILFTGEPTVRDGEAQEDVFQNGSVVTVACSPWIGIRERSPDRKAIVPALLRIIMSMEGDKHKLLLQS